MNAQTDPIHVLAVSPVEADLTILSNLIGHSAWTLNTSATAKAAEAILRKGEVQVVLCDAHLPDADWKKFLEIKSAFPNPPEVIVLSRRADERLWAEVLNLGAWDVLLKPFPPQRPVPGGSCCLAPLDRHEQNSQKSRLRNTFWRSHACDFGGEIVASGRPDNPCHGDFPE